jgi:hypothetical protein
MEIPNRMVNRGEARRRFGELVDRMGYWLKQGDPLADDLIEATRDWPRGRLLGALSTAIREGPEAVDGAPEELHALIEQVTTVPAWVDRDRLERGGAFFLSTHIIGGIVLGAKSLISGYTSPAGNKPLVLSGRLGHGTHRRLAETARFVYDVSKLGGLEPGGDGVVAAVTVRMIHAQVRDMIGRKTSWNDEWGAPINQHDMLATLLLFSTHWQEGLRTLGLEPTDREIRDHIALWRYIGHLMGVDSELLPANRHDADRYGAFIELTQGPPDDDARELTRALIESRPPDEEDVKRPLGHVLARALIRELLGESLADDLAVPRSPLTPVIRGLRPLVSTVHRLRETSAGFRTAVELGNRYWQHVLENNPNGIVEFTLHDELFGLSRDAA